MQFGTVLQAVTLRLRKRQPFPSSGRQKVAKSGGIDIAKNAARAVHCMGQSVCRGFLQQ